MTRTSTEYYRENRRTRRVIYHCPHCLYETAGSRSQLINHVNARHILEEARPHQCTLCTRGFAQKAHLHNHLRKEHNVAHLAKRKISTIAYVIKSTEKEPKSVKTKARYQYYQSHSLIKSREIKDNKYEYMPGIYLKLHDIHYDTKKGFITINRYQLCRPDNERDMERDQI